MSCTGPDVVPCSSPVAGERQKPYQSYLDLSGIRIDLQGRGLARGASNDDSGERGPGEMFIYDCQMIACCPFSCICGRL